MGTYILHPLFICFLFLFFAKYFGVLFHFSSSSVGVCCLYLCADFYCKGRLDYWMKIFKWSCLLLSLLINFLGPAKWQTMNSWGSSCVSFTSSSSSFARWVTSSAIKQGKLSLLLAAAVYIDLHNNKFQDLKVFPELVKIVFLVRGFFNNSIMIRPEWYPTIKKNLCKI